MKNEQSQQQEAIPIGIAIVIDNGRALVGTRHGNTHLAGYDEFPGGKCGSGESAAACAIRECLEETGVRTEVVELLHSEHFDYPERTVDLSFFLCSLIAEEASTDIDPPFRWVMIRELPHLNFPVGNRRVIERLIDRFKQEDKVG